MKEFFKRKLIHPLIDLLKQGITPEKIALSMAFGALLGIFPIIGSTVILCMLATYLLKLNIIAIQVVNYLVYPIQLILFIPFIRIGENLFQVQPFPLSMEKIFFMIKDDLPNAFKLLWLTNLYGVVAWCLIAPFAIALIYFVLLPILRKLPLGENSKEEKQNA